jgi:hypothetical protein
LQLIRPDKYQFSLGEVGSYVKEKARDFGFTDLDEDDYAFVSYLITSSENQDSAWVLEMHPEESANLFSQFLKLYDSLTTESSSAMFTYLETKRKIEVDRALTSSSSPKTYSPSQDKIVPLIDIIAPLSYINSASLDLSNLVSETGRKERINAMNETYSIERNIYTIADIRTLDHVLMLLLDIKLWDTFVTPRSKPDPSQNLERAKGLRVLAAYIQTLLMYPHIFRYELFREGYAQIEEWHGSFPTIPAHVTEDYNKFVANYDLLGAASDVKKLMQLYTPGTDSTLGSKVHVIFEEIGPIFGISDLLREIGNINVGGSTINIDHLRELKKPEYDHLLQSFPLAPFNLIDTIQSRVFESQRYVTVATQVIGFLMPGYNRYYKDETIQTLRDLNCRIPFDWHQGLAVTIPVGEGSLPTAQEGKLNLDYSSPFASAYNNYLLKTVEDYRIGNIAKFASNYPVITIIDHSVAAHLRTQLHRTWKTYYPANLIPGDRISEAKTFQSSELEVKRLMEYIAGDAYSVLQRSLFNLPLLEIWATVLSSFALLFRKGPGLAHAQQIAGKGMPYGTSYQHLADLQKIDEAKDLIHLPETDMYIAFLKKVPLPSSRMSMSDFHLHRPYYYFPGNGNSLSVEMLTTGESMYNFALRPLRDIGPLPKVLLDKIYAYANDTLYMHVDAQANYKIEDKAYFSFSFPLTKVDWKAEKLAAQIDFITPGSYSTFGSNTAVANPGSESQTLMNLMTSIATEEKQADEQSTISQTANASKPPIDEDSVARAINGKGAKSDKDSE